MCGIIAIASEKRFPASSLLSRLKALEYRGYDSFGYASAEHVAKGIGRITVAKGDARVLMREGIAHTRWATHGGVTRENAHPHKAGRVTLVHNGIIENYASLLADDAGNFLSETDSERLAALIDRELAGTPQSQPLDAILRATRRATGTWALAALIEGEEGIFLARNKAPLLVGKLADSHIAASDARGLVDATHICQIGDGMVAHMRHDGLTVLDRDGQPVSTVWEKNQLERAQERPAGYAMEHEILETPAVIARLASEWRVTHDPLAHDQMTILGCGSSYNAALLAVTLAGAQEYATVQLASESDIRTPVLLAVSQSGETADVLDAVERAKARGTRVLAIVNTPHSTLTKMADRTYLLHAGEERCVAATKSFTSQTALIAALLGKGLFDDAIAGAQAAIADRETTLRAAEALKDAQDIFVIGRRTHYPLAKELALKLKEIAYQHAEAVPALELKHGTLALITEGTPVLALGDAEDARLSSTMHEVAARGGKVIAWNLGSAPRDVFRALVAGQLLTFEIARLRGLPIDMPRNLAKSVTVF